ncbi:hypothetical protein OE88DRAFT_1804047 [Heliocybe sulcata]|uniref:Uncharacterized protein n=1 Tax=Heliocybe sulcata TaxID=5364 RepID=A0A5C3NKV8_9AGAM|nr:hypothetical protein OE88DRAFT_1804047 [Heliocybe sulcata]
MLCTRWFLPLLILPVPTAQPYFLILFLLSLILHARPCFYCISLLTALFMSSCYWQPISIDSPLSVPWSENVTTFSDAWDVTLTNITIPKPAAMRLTDRCWVDWSFGGIFNPFNVTEWERVSIAKLKFDMLQEKRRRDVESDSESPSTSDPSSQPGDSLAGAPAAVRYGDSRNQTAGSAGNFLTRGARLGGMLRDITASIWRRGGADPAGSDEEMVSANESAPIPHINLTSVESAIPHLPWFRKEYDLRPYGFDVIFDFGWS